jgi:hypothetical protein
MLQSFVAKFYRAPPRFAGGVILNILGYQILRIIYFNLCFWLRRKRSLENAQTEIIASQLLKDGIVVIPNYFPTDVFAEIKRECDKQDLTIINDQAPRVEEFKFTPGNSSFSGVSVLEKYIGRNKSIENIVSRVMRKDVLVPPKVYVVRTSFRKEDLGKETTDVKSDNLHFDVSYPTIKTFLYLDDVDETENGPFNFVKGSHKLTWARLWMEYRLSVSFYWKWSEEQRRTFTPEVSFGFVEKMGLAVSPISGKANTLVIANLMGLHRRGTFFTDKARYVVITSYRDLESMRHLKLRLTGGKG